MAASPSAPSSLRAASRSSLHARAETHRHSAGEDNDDSDDGHASEYDDDGERNDASLPSIPVETLVEHLLHAKRSLSSMSAVLRGNELATSAVHLHEESVILGAQTAFLRRGITEQVQLLLRIRKGMLRAYDAGKRDFQRLIKTMDVANDRLENTMDMLRNTMVEATFRPKGEEPRNLMDFVDEKSVDSMRNAVKENIHELQVRSGTSPPNLARDYAKLHLD